MSESAFLDGLPPCCLKNNVVFLIVGNELIVGFFCSVTRVNGTWQQELSLDWQGREQGCKICYQRGREIPPVSTQ